jgi:hypothetical protein
MDNNSKHHKIRILFLATILSLSSISNIFSVSSSPSFSSFTFLNDTFAFEGIDNENSVYNYNDYYDTNSISTAGNSNHQQIIDCSNDNLNVNGVESNIDAFSAATNNHNNLHDQMQDFIEGENTYNDDNNNHNDNSIFENKNLLNICANLNLNGQAIIVEQADHIYVVWEDTTNGGDTDIFFRVSHDNGLTFNPVIDLSDNDGVSSNPRMLVSGNNVFVAWQDTTNAPSDNELFFRASNDNGLTFNPFINLSNSRGESRIPTMLVSGNNLYIAWADEELSNDEFSVLFRASNDNGLTFNPVIDLSPNHDISGFSMLISGNNVYVVMADLGAPADILDIYFRASNDNGLTFNPVINLSDNPGSSSSPRMFVSGNNVYILWIDTTNGGDTDIFFRASNDNGLAFEPFIDLSNNAGESRNPQMLVSGNNVYVAWSDEENSNDEFTVLFRASNDNGQTFNPVIDLSLNHDTSTFRMLASENNVYVVLIDIDGGDDTYFRASNDNGLTFNPIINLSDNVGFSSNPIMLVSGNNVYVTWIDTTNGGDTDIFFRPSNDNGQTFNSIIDISDDTGVSNNQQMIVQ